VREKDDISVAFLKNIFSRFTKRRNTASASDAGVIAPAIHIAAFGKHPGWDDHIDDIGVDTERLVAVKRTLYLQGIGGNVDAGTWERLSEQQRLGGFNHLLLWRNDADVVVARLASSTDGKGRGRYPIIICAQCIGLPLRTTVDEVAPLLERALSACTLTRDAQEVRRIIGEAREQAVAIVAVSATNPPPTTSRERDDGSAPIDDQTAAAAHRGNGDSLTGDALVDAPQLGPDAGKLHSVLFQIEREMSMYRPVDGASRSSALNSIGGTPHLRVPACAKVPALAARLWLEFLASQLARSAPILSIAAVDQEWVDLMVGEPKTQDFFCLLASREMIPFTTDIPYKMDPAFVERATRLLAGYRRSADGAAPC
jgi:hypothetical protein